MYPLATMVKVTKEDILDWWSKQPFDLEISEEQGNCWFCYKKSDKKLQMIAEANPEAFDFIKDMESKYPEDIKIFRHHRTVDDILHNKGLPERIGTIDDCAEECGTMS